MKNNKFKSLNLSDVLIRQVESVGYINPTPIQKSAIPAVLDGKDILGNAQTGTGKTASYLLPIIDKLYKIKGAKKRVNALILVPTRELAIQVHEAFKLYSKGLEITSTLIYGGANIELQKKEIAKNSDIVIATTGRLLDILATKNANISKVNMLVVDEADRMFDMGFIDEVQTIMSVFNKKPQTMLFSATFSKKVKEFAHTILTKPKVIDIAKDNKLAPQIKQLVHQVDCDKKLELLSYMIGSLNMKQVLVFTRTKLSADMLKDELNDSGLKTEVIHKDIKQGARTKALNSFKSGKIRVLVATDIASRGLNIEFLPYVINYELPTLAEDYIHRVGRTGRGDNSGEAFTIVCYEELNLLNKIEMLIKSKIPKFIIDGYAPTKSFRQKQEVKNSKNKEKFIKQKQSTRDNILKEEHKRVKKSKKITKRDRRWGN